MVKIKMKKTQEASLDGIRLFEFQAGEEYSVRDRLAEILVDQMGVAARVVDKPKPAPKVKQKTESKAAKPPENK